MLAKFELFFNVLTLVIIFFLEFSLCLIRHQQFVVFDFLLLLVLIYEILLFCLLVLTVYDIYLIFFLRWSIRHLFITTWVILEIYFTIQKLRRKSITSHTHNIMEKELFKFEA